ncbi:MAG TPA: RsbRD N-terminal domain-containing protein, partial [Nitrospiraceae bacterium]|nr:RsbRD N-terminal domain-containing protein [Nitrospiraceae bacterium]
MPVRVAQTIQIHEDAILKGWMAYQSSDATLRRDLIKETELLDQSRQFLRCFARALEHEKMDTEDPSWKPVEDLLTAIAKSRALQGFTPSETATFVFSLKQPLFDLLQAKLTDAKELVQEIWNLTVLLDKLGLYVTEAHQLVREEIVSRQQQELLELSTPVVQLFDNI